MSSAVRHLAVLGSPIAHSLSPVLHRAAYDALGLDWTYDAVEVDEAGLPTLLNGLGEDWRGLSLTMPLKRAVVPLLDQTDPLVELSGVANTVVLSGDRRWGHNTDVPGAVAAVRERAPGVHDTATILGAGATAASLALALADLGVHRITIGARDPERARSTVQIARSHASRPEVDLVPVDEAPVADIVASTIPSAAVNGPMLARLAEAPVVFDVIYHPWPTDLAAAASRQGGVVVSGLDLLVHQANLQNQLFTGTQRDLVDVMRAAGEAALGTTHD